MSVEPLIVCQFEECKMIFEHPVTLPCGESLCLKHIERCIEKFKCSFCDEEHQIPQNGGFKMNKTINMLMNKFLKIDPFRKEIYAAFDKLVNLIDDYEKIDPESYIFDNLGEIINKVDLHREELIKEINDKYNEIIKRLKEKGLQCKLNALKLEKMNLEELTTDILPSMKQSLRIADLKQEELNELLEKMNEKIGAIQSETKKYKSDILMNEAIYFDQHEKSSSFGILSLNSDEKIFLSRNCGEKMLTYENLYSDFITSIQINEESNRLITASRHQMIMIMNLKTGQIYKIIEDHQEAIRSILIIPNNKFISGSVDCTIKIWSLNSYECLQTLENELSVYSLCLISENQIACGCGNGTINIWNLESLTKVKSFRAHLFHIKCLLLVDNSKLISCSADYIIKIWDIETFDCIRELEGHSGCVNYLESSSDGRLLFSCSRDRTVNIWQIETGELLKSIEFDKAVNCVKILNQDLIIVSLAYGHIQIYNINKMKIVKTIKNHLSSDIGPLHLLKNGNLISGSNDCEIIVSKLIE